VRLIKTFGLAAIAATTVMAFVGVSSALAITELEEVVNCKVKTDPCPVGSDWGAGTVIDGHAENTVLLTSLGNISCKLSTQEGEQTELLAHGAILALSFTDCLLGSTTCTFTAEHLGYLVLVLLNPAMDGGYHAVLSSGGSGNPQVHVVCGSLINCSFGASEVLFSIEEMEHDTLWIVLQSLARTGGICPSISVWHAVYLVRCLNPTGTFVDCFPKMETIF